MIPAILFGFYLGITVRPTEAQDNSSAFDHSQCQYPNRPTNLPEGCDNSDLCDPTNIKDGGDCASLPQNPIIEPVQQVLPIEQKPAPGCTT